MDLKLLETISIAICVKLNTNGSCIEGNCEGGGVVRDKDGKFIMAFCLPLGRGNSNLAEAASFCLVLNGNWQSPWRIEDIVNRIKYLMELNQITTNHCFREANKVADKLASLSHSNGNT
ncbi:uncharacterized protein LOC132611702 [Lycium barbarum]|uniref:uncharacterized protein LOC132611702 n=1 Tax=Lycium barbarum TaxID=112863 RepID=UPI00293E78A4|nr:uncharacterized protein LOC132611702 [Lycium barbarum]